MLSSEASRRITNFKPIRLDFGPFEGLERVTYDNSEMTPISLQALQDYLNSVEFLNILRWYITSEEFQEDFQDNIEDSIEFDRNYYIIDKDKIYNSLNNINDASNILSEDDKIALLYQKDYYNLGTSYTLPIDNINLFDYMAQDELLYLLNKQSNFYSRVPTYQQLSDTGVISRILEDVFNLNYLTEEEINNKLNDKLEDMLKTTIYLTYDQIEAIYNNPQNINNIISPESYSQLLERNQNLAFITSDDINGLLLEEVIYPVYNADQIKQILESENNLINIYKSFLTPQMIDSKIEEAINNITINNNIDIEVTDNDVLGWIEEILIQNN